MRVGLIHHHRATEATSRAESLSALGYEVDCRPFGRDVLTGMRDSPPDAIVIDLERAPSIGRDVAVSIRMRKSTRAVPVVFAGGDPQKVERIRALLPDATYTSWAGVAGALADAIAHPPENPVVPASVMAAYRGTPLVKKLGIKRGSTLVLDGAPEGFATALVGLPDDVSVTSDPSCERDMTLWFVRSRRELEERISEMGANASGGGLWITWPKKASGVVSDLSQTVVRAVGLASGLVDFKVCSVDATWSGLRFTVREPKPG
jgi:CheY-like chemotaxis protein